MTPTLGIDGLIELTRERLAPPTDAQWRLVSTRTKLAKTLFEIEEISSSGRKRIVAKLATTSRGNRAFVALQKLWQAGFRPPSEFTVCKPLAWIPEHGMLVIEKAPGLMLLDLIRGQAPEAPEKAGTAARCLAALHASGVEAEPCESALPRIQRYERELCECLPAQSKRIRQIARRLTQAFSESRLAVPTHGDFHPMNIFIDDGRITLIDLDTFALREPAADVAYLLAQTMIMGWMAFGDFGSSATVRAAFLNSYQANSAYKLDPERIRVHCAYTFLQSLHYERCVLRTGNDRIIDCWLDRAEDFG